MVTQLAKRNVNEPGFNYLQQEVRQAQKTSGDLRKEIEGLRQDRSMLLDVLSEITEEETLWADTVETKTIRFRLKNVLNSIKNG